MLLAISSCKTEKCSWLMEDWRLHLAMSINEVDVNVVDNWVNVRNPFCSATKKARGVLTGGLREYTQLSASMQ